jgi:hypothetical protein
MEVETRFFETAGLGVGGGGDGIAPGALSPVCGSDNFLFE